MDQRAIVLLHGVGGPEDLDPVLTLMNDHLGSRGYETLAPASVIIVDYDEILAEGASTTEPLRETWRPSSDSARRETRAAFVERAARIRARLDRTENAANSVWTAAPTTLTDLATLAPPLAQVRRYTGSSDVRWAVRRAILRMLPKRGEVVLVGHSLGTVIAVDLIPYLPEGITVRSLVTLASPLGFVPRLRAHSNLMSRRDGFPFGRVQAWTNLYCPSDLVTGGRGIASCFPWAADAPIAAGGHGLRGHLNHPATLEVLEEALGATYLPAEVGGEVDRPLADDWIPQLLTFAWSQRLGDAYAGKDENLRRRLRAARAELARRSIEEYVRQVANLDEEIAQAGELGRSTMNRLDDLRAHPNETELLDRAGDLLSGRLGRVSIG